MTQHKLEVWELEDAQRDNFAGYNVGDMIYILHNNQMGEEEPEVYKILKTYSGKKIQSDKLIINNPPVEFKVNNLEELKNLLEYSGSMGDGVLGIGDIIYVGEQQTTVDLDDYGYEIAVDEYGNKINNEGNVYMGGKKTRKNKRKSCKNKRKTCKNKRKSRKNKRKSNKRKSNKRKLNKRKLNKHKL